MKEIQKSEPQKIFVPHIFESEVFSNGYFVFSWFFSETSTRRCMAVKFSSCGWSMGLLLLLSLCFPLKSLSEGKKTELGDFIGGDINSSNNLNLMRRGSEMGERERERERIENWVFALHFHVDGIMSRDRVREPSEHPRARKPCTHSLVRGGANPAAIIKVLLLDRSKNNNNNRYC